MRIPKMRDDRPTMAELLLLINLPDSVTNLSQSLNVNRQRIYKIGIACQKKGWINRSKRGRFVTLELTPKGQQAITKFKKMLG